VNVLVKLFYTLTEAFSELSIKQLKLQTVAVFVYATQDKAELNLPKRD
jgi:hypothetical protein